jgi:hypothetical protein
MGFFSTVPTKLRLFELDTELATSQPHLEPLALFLVQLIIILTVR